MLCHNAPIGGREGGDLVPTFEQLAAVSLARGDLERDDVALRLVQELDWDTDRGGHGRYVNRTRL